MSKEDLDWYWEARQKFFAELTNPQLTQEAPSPDIVQRKTNMDNELMKRDPIAFRTVAYIAHVTVSELGHRPRLKREDTQKLIVSSNDGALPLARVLYDFLTVIKTS